MIINTLTGALFLIMAVLLIAFVVILSIGIMVVADQLRRKWANLPRAKKITWVVGLPLFLFASYWIGYAVQWFSIIKI